MQRFTFGVCLLMAVLAQGCKPQGMTTLNDAATTSSFKSGIFAPLLDQELSNADVPIWSVENFLKEARRLSGNPNLSVRGDGTLIFAVVANGEGEQLLTGKKTDSVDIEPLLSIKGRVLYQWGSTLYPARHAGEVLKTNLLQKWVYGKQPAPTVQTLFVKRNVWTANEFREPVIVPWLRHVASETAQLVTFRVGNAVFSAATGRPVLEFKRYKAEPIWVVMGPYRDADVKGGTIFWKAEGKGYLSIDPTTKKVTQWKKQDGDSLDRVSVLATVPKLPTIVKNLLAEMPAASAKNHPAKSRVKGFNAQLGDRSVFELLDNSVTKPSATAGFSLAAAAGEKIHLTEADYNDAFSLGLFSYFFGPEEVPYNIVNREKAHAGNIPFDAIVYKDRSGVQHAGVVVSEGSQDDVRTFTVWNRDEDVVYTIDQSGERIGATLPYDQYKNSVVGKAALKDYLYGAGGDAAAEAHRVETERQEGAAIVNQELEKVEALVGEGDAPAMGARMLTNIGVDAAVAEAPADGMLDQVINKELGHQMKSLMNGEGVASDVAFDMGSMLTKATKTGISSSDVDLVLGAPAADNKVYRDRAATVAAAGVETVTGVYDSYQDRSGDGMDYLDNVRTYAAEPTVATWHAVVDLSFKQFEAVPGAKAAKSAINAGPEQLFNSAEAFTRSTNAYYSAQNPVLDEITNRNADIIEAQETLPKLDTYDALRTGGGSMPSETAPDAPIGYTVPSSETAPDAPT